MGDELELDSRPISCSKDTLWMVHFDDPHCLTDGLEHISWKVEEERNYLLRNVTSLDSSSVMLCCG